MSAEWGSVRRRGGSWQLRWPLPPDPLTGARGVGTKTVRGTEEEARAELERVRMELTCWRPGSGSPTASQFYDGVWLPEVCEHLAPSTVEGYRRCFENHVRPAFGDVRMSDVRGRDVQAWLERMPYGAARHAKAVASAMWGRAEALDLVEGNIFKRRYRLPSKQTRSRQPNATLGSAETLARLASAMEGEPWEAAFLAAAFGGLRRSEAFGLTADDVLEVEAGGARFAGLHVRRGVQRVGGVVRETPVKTELSERWAVMAMPQAGRMLQLAREAAEDGRAWLSGDGRSVPDPDRLADAYKRWFQGRPEVFVPFRNLRNSYTTNLHDAGMELENVAKLLGHSTDSITYRHYDRPDLESLALRLGQVTPAEPVPAAR